MTEKMDMWARLAAPFPPESVSWRVGSVNKTSKRGLALAYLDSRDVQDRLDMVCGPENWQCRYPHALAKTVCEIDVWVDGKGWVTKADGAGDSDIEAEKGALSDAFKRAAVKWGIGRYLYGMQSPWVALDDNCKHILDSEMPRLQALLRPGAPAKHPANSPKAMALKGQLATLVKSIREAADEGDLADLLADADVKEARADALRILPDWSARLEETISETRAAFNGKAPKSAIVAGADKGFESENPGEGMGF